MSEDVGGSADATNTEGADSGTDTTLGSSTGTDQGNQDQGGNDQGNQGTDGQDQGNQGQDQDQGNQDGNQTVEFKDFTLPDNFQFQDGMLDEFTQVAQEFGLNQEQAQKLIDLGVKHSEKVTESTLDMTETRTQWLDDLKSDPEWGGAKIEQTKLDAQKAISQFADQNVLDVLNSSGLGDNNHMIVMFAKIQQKLGEDKHHEGGEGKGDKSAAKTLYPNLK